MRVMLSTIGVALLALVSVAADAAPPPQSVPCAGVVLRPKTLDRSHRIVLDRVAFPGTRVWQTASTHSSLPYSSKALVFVRPGRSAVTISVPLAWRDRAAISWGGTTATHTLRFPSCPTREARWNGWNGLFYVQAPACVPLHISVGQRSAMLRLGIGNAC